MPENAITGVIVARKGRYWKVLLEKDIRGGFVSRMLAADGLKLADARAEAERMAQEHGVQVKEIK